MGQIIKVDGTKTDFNPADGKYFSLKELQEVVGGMIEVLNLPDGKIMLLNEEGKLLRLPINEKATLITLGVLAYNDLVCGDVAIVEISEMSQD